MPSRYESLTANFYRWEKRGRGWQVWERPVELEPPFEPFVHAYSRASSAIDDGRKPTRIGSWVEKLAGRLAGTVTPQSALDGDAGMEATDPEPQFACEESPLIFFQISLAPDQVITKESAERFLLSLSRSRRPISFEMMGTAEVIIVQVVCRETDRGMVQHQLNAYFPQAVVNATDKLGDSLNQSWVDEGLVIDFGLSYEFMRPLSTFRTLDVDPLVGIAGALSGINSGEVGIVQILFQGVEYPWADSIIRSVTDWQGEAFFLDAPEMVGLAREKIEHPLFAVVLRVAGMSNDLARSADIIKGIGSALTQFSRPGSNEFIPLTNNDYDDYAHQLDLLERTSHRSGMILNARELGSMAHPPSASVRSEKLKREIKRTKAAPPNVLGNELLLGENTHQGKTVSVRLNPEQRMRHTYVIGATGTGKSTLLLNMIVQDIANGRGVAVLDPQGDLVDQVLERIPEERFEEVVLIDPADTDFPVGFNILSAHSDVEKNILASDLGAVFRRLATSWGDQMTSVLGNAIIAFLESDKGGTLLELRRFLVDREFRNSFLRTVRDPHVVSFWQREFPLLTGKPHASVLTRLDTFLRPKIIRNMVAQRGNKISFQGMLDHQKIFLVKLSEGLIGEENAYLLGSLIVSKLHQIIMARQELRESERKPFYLYLDEFHHFITPSMAAILAGARKYRLGLTLAHHELQQLWDRDRDVASSVITHPATRICFRLGDFDAKKLEDGFSFFRSEDLQNLGVGEALCRIERAEYDFNLRTLSLPEVKSNVATSTRESLILRSREKYARRREEVEAEWLREDSVTERAVPTEGQREEQRKKSRPYTEGNPREEAVKPSLRTLKDETIRTGTTDGTDQKTKARPSQPYPPGRGGQQHKYLQNLFKRMGEDRGYRATIEKEILGGIGKVDVALERAGQSIACEISITTDPKQEVANIQKCVAGGFEQVIFVSADKKMLDKVKTLASAALVEQDWARVHCLAPDKVDSFLDQIEAQAAATEQTIRGYKVKTNYTTISEAEKKTRKKIIAETIVKALKKMKT